MLLIKVMGDILRNEARMIVVTGSTGNVGGPLIGELAAMGVPTRALVHTPETFFCKC